MKSSATAKTFVSIFSGGAAVPEIEMAKLAKLPARAWRLDRHFMVLAYLFWCLDGKRILGGEMWPLIDLRATHQLPHMGRHSAGEAVDVVAAFQDGDEAGIAVSLRGFEEVAGEQDEVLISEAELAERVVDA